MRPTYWQVRWDDLKQQAFDKLLVTSENAMRTYYLSIAQTVVQKLVAVYNKLLNLNNGELTRNMLYTYEGYYEMLDELQENLEKLGVKLDKTLLKSLKDTYKNAVELTGEQLKGLGVESSFNRLDERAELVVKELWSADGETWSKKVWKNTVSLKERLMSRLTSAIATGEGALILESELMREFSVSYSKARRLVVTEMSHFYNQGSLDRMSEAGIEEWQWYTSKDEKVCPVCRGLDGKRFPITDKSVPPDASHPMCRCTTLAVLSKSLPINIPDRE